MNINIAIKSIGYNVGTIGYLRAGLETSSLRLEEGKLKSNGNHGLWLQGERTQFLAAFNRHDFTTCLNMYGNSIDNGASEYAIADFEDRNPIWTNAAWESLMEIAQKWCDERNECRVRDGEAVTV